MGYSPWDCKELDMTENIRTLTHSLRPGLKPPPSRAAVSALCLQGAAPSLLLGVLAWLLAAV